MKYPTSEGIAIMLTRNQIHSAERTWTGAGGTPSAFATLTAWAHEEDAHRSQDDRGDDNLTGILITTDGRVLAPTRLLRGGPGRTGWHIDTRLFDLASVGLGTSALDDAAHHLLRHDGDQVDALHVAVSRGEVRFMPFECRATRDARRRAWEARLVVSS